MRAAFALAAEPGSRVGGWAAGGWARRGGLQTRRPAGRSLTVGCASSCGSKWATRAQRVEL